MIALLAGAKKATEEKKYNAADAEAQKWESALKTAKETGKRVVISRWMEECNDRNEECDQDSVCRVATPEGKIIIVRSHCY